MPRIAGSSSEVRNVEDRCPKCGSADIMDKIRQYAEHPGVVDIGWECERCEWEWGFEMSEASQRKDES